MSLVSTKQRDYLTQATERARAKVIENAGLIQNQRRQTEIERNLQHLNNEIHRLKIEFAAVSRSDDRCWIPCLEKTQSLGNERRDWNRNLRTHGRAAGR